MPEGVLVKEVLCHAILGCPHLPQVGDMVAQLLDGLHLLIQVVSFDEVTQLKRRLKKGLGLHIAHPAETGSEIILTLPSER